MLRKLTLAISLCSLWMLQACGPQKIPDVEPQTIGQLDQPLKYPVEQDEKRLPLTGENGVALSYKIGSLVFWNPEAKYQDLLPIMRASKRFRDTYADFYQNFKYGDEKNLKAEIDSHEKAIQSIDAEKLKILAQAKRDKALDVLNYAQGFMERVISHEAKNDAHKQKLAQMFAGYCEAKIWQLATSMAFHRTLYKEMPSPTPFCQKYYNSQKFFEHESCTSEPNGGYRSLSRCVWHAVLKTQWFDSRYGIYPSDFMLSSGQSIDRQEYLKSLIDDESRIWQLTMARWGGFEGEKNPVVGTGLSDERLGSLSFILAQKSKRGCQKDGEDDDYWLELSDICQLFQREKSLGYDGDDRPMVWLTPEQLIKLVELTPSQVDGYPRTVVRLKVNGKRIRWQPVFDLERKQSLSGAIVYSQRGENGEVITKTINRNAALRYGHLLRYAAGRVWYSRSELDLLFDFQDASASPYPEGLAASPVHKEAFGSSEVYEAMKELPIWQPMIVELSQEVHEEIARQTELQARKRKEILTIKAQIEALRAKYQALNDEVSIQASQLTWSPYRPWGAEGAAYLFNQAGDICRRYPDLFAGKRQQLCDVNIFQLEDDRSACHEKYNGFLTAWQRDGIGPSAALSSLSLSLEIELTPQQVMLSFSRGAGKLHPRFIACAARSSGEPQPCEQTPAGEQKITQGKLKYDIQRGIFNFSLPTDASYVYKESDGLQPLLPYIPLAEAFCAQTPRFQTIPAQSLAGKTLALELVADRQGEHIYILSGKATIAGEGESWEGAVTSYSMH